MKKELLKRAGMGFFAGVTIGQIISLIISFCVGKGEFIAVSPEFTASAGNETMAVAIQTLFCGIMGAGFSATSMIWEMDSLNLALQTGICFGIYALILFPIAYFSYWMEHTMAGFLEYFGVFFGIFVMIWIVKYIMLCKKIKDINMKINQ